MKYEKMFYLLIGCIITGTLVQSNMGLSWQYFIIITISLWGTCVGVCYYMNKREQVQKKEDDNRERKIRNEEIERILNTIEGSVDKQIKSLKEEMNLLKENQTTTQRKIVEEIHENFIAFEGMQKQIIELNTKEFNCLNKCVSDLSGNLICCEKILSMLSNIKNDSNSSKQALLKEIKGVQKNVLEKNKKIDEWKTNYLNISSNMQKELESILGKIEELSQLENKVVEDFKKIPEIISHNHKEMFQMIKKDRDESIEILEKGLSSINDIDSKVLNKIGTLAESVDRNVEVIVGGMGEKTTMLRESIGENIGYINEELKQLQNSLNNIYINTSNMISNMESDTNNVERISNEFKGIISNLQESVDMSNQFLSNIDNVGNQNVDVLEDVKNNITNIDNDIKDGVEYISDSVAKGMEKQDEIVSSEKMVLDSYDKLLSRINDEVVVKLINDSNNLLKCMRDCYNLLESCRRANKK